MARAWVRILLCGMVAGMAWFLLSAVSLGLLGQELLASVQRARSYPRMEGGFFFGIDLMMGVWAMWLYSAIVPRYGTGRQAATIVGIAWWVLKTLQSAKWMGVGLLPAEVVVAPLATTLVATIAASTLGAWLYEKVELAATQARQR